LARDVQGAMDAAVIKQISACSGVDCWELIRRDCVMADGEIVVSIAVIAGPRCEPDMR